MTKLLSNLFVEWLDIRQIKTFTLLQTTHRGQPPQVLLTSIGDALISTVLVALIQFLG
jgi:hypothetical protein